MTKNSYTRIPGRVNVFNSFSNNSFGLLYIEIQLEYFKRRIDT